MFKLTFARKITLSILLTALFISLLYTSITIVREQSAMTETIVNEKMGLSEFLAKTLEVAEATAGIAYRHRLIKEIGAYKDVVYVRIVKPTGEIYLSTDREEMGKFIKDPAIFTNKTIVKDDLFNEENIKVAVSPTTSGYTLWLGFSLKELQHTIYESLFLNLLVFLPIFILIILVSFFLSKGMIGPVKKLIEGVESIGKGNLGYHIDVKSRDEMGELASAFNQMTIDLKGSREKLEEYSKTLEKQVTERTKELERSKKELESKLDELERFSKLSVGRELKMIELKKRVKELEDLLRKHGIEPKGESK